MKSVRHAVIKEIIESQDIETQEELAAALRARNIDVTQATVSRDIKELRLLKVLSEKGSYKYATADKAEHGLADRFIRIFNESVISIVPASNATDSSIAIHCCIRFFFIPLPSFYS